MWLFSYQYEYDHIYFKSGYSDDYMYEKFAAKLSVNSDLDDLLFYSKSHQDSGISMAHNSIGYINLVTLFHKISNTFFEYNTLIPRIFNVFISAVIGYLIYRFLNAHNISSVQSKFFGFIFIAMPPVSFVSSFVFRDIIIAFLIFLLFIINYRKYNFALFKIFIFVFSLLIIFYTFYYRQLTAITLTILYILIHIYNFRSRFIRNGTIVIFIFSLPLFILNSHFLEYLYNYMIHYTMLRSGHGSVTSSIWEVPFPYLVPVRMLFGFFSPYPGLSMTFYNLANTLNLILMLICSFYFIKGTILCLKSYKFILLPLFYFAFFIPFALISGAPRHTVYFLPFFMIIVSLGLNYKKILYSKNA